jgi:hypothetical protein
MDDPAVTALRELVPAVIGDAGPVTAAGLRVLKLASQP